MSVGLKRLTTTNGAIDRIAGGTNIEEQIVKQEETFDVDLITCPRRFGKTLTMSMLEDFFDISRDSRVDFEVLAVMQEKKLCAQWMNQWLTVFVTLKNIEGNTFQGAYAQLKALLSDFCVSHLFL